MTTESERRPILYTCQFCGYAEMETDDLYGCPNCHGEGLTAQA